MNDEYPALGLPDEPQAPQESARPQTPKPPLVAGGGRVLAIIPRTFDEAYRIGNAAVQGKWAPYGWTKEQATLAIMHGAEVGLPPMMSLQKICVINGRPSLWGDAVPAIALATGQLEDWSEGIRGEGEVMEAFCIVKRRGIKTPMETTFSVADARRAGLWDERPIVAKNVWDKKTKQKVWKADAENDSPWYRHPKRMLQMRARRAFRDAFADAFSGLYIAEEMQDGAEMRDVTPESDRVTISNPLQDDAEVVDHSRDFSGSDGGPLPDKRPNTVNPVDGDQVDTGDEFDQPAAPEPPKPSRQPRKKAQDAPKPADAPTQPEAEKASPAPNAGLLDWRGLDAKALAKKTGADYIEYLLMWTNAAVDFKSVPETIRTRYNSERDIRNNLGTPLDANQSAEAKQIAAEAYKKLGGV